MENYLSLICVGLVTLFFVVPMWVYIVVTERTAKAERAKAIEAGRNEPVTIQPYVNLAVCMGAGACVTACPEHVLAVIEGQAVAVNMSACIGHGVCVPACPVDAIELVFGSEKRGIDIPEVGPGFESNVKGLYIAGELGGMGLIAAAAEQGVKAMEAAAVGLQKRPGRKDVLIVGAGPAGLAAALVAKQKGLDYLMVDQSGVGGAVLHYPRKKLVFTRPMSLPLYGKVNLKQLYKEELVALFRDIVAKTGIEVSAGERVDSVKALPDGTGFAMTTSQRTIEGTRVILAMGRGGTPRKLGVKGEELEKVAYSLLEPEQFQQERVLVVGGGDSAVEAAMQLGEQPGNKVVLSYRGDKINRPKEKNIKRLRDAVKKGQVELLLESQVKEIGPDRVVLDQKSESVVLPNDHVFVFAGGVLPTKFLQDAGIVIRKHYGKRIVDGDEEKRERGEKKERGEKERGEKGERGEKKERGEKTEGGARGEPGERAEKAGSAEKAGRDRPAPGSLPTAILPGPGDETRILPPAPGSVPTAIVPEPGSTATAILPPAPGSVPTAIVPEPGSTATAILPEPGSAATAILPLAGAPPVKLGDLPTATLPADVRDALLLELEAERDDSTVPRAPRFDRAADAGGFDEAGALPAEPEPPRARKEVTEIQPLRRVPTDGAPRDDRAAAPASRAPAPRSAAPGPTPSTPAPAPGRTATPAPAAGRTATPAPAAGRTATPAPAAGRTATPAPAAGRAVTPAPAPGREDVPGRVVAGATGDGQSAVSRGFGRSYAGPRPELRPVPEARAEVSRRIEPLTTDDGPAAPLLERAREHLEDGRFGDALRDVNDLDALVARSASALGDAAGRVSRKARILEGRAHLGLGDWASAIPPLEAAVELARGERDPDALGDALRALGRAAHHAEQFERARAALEEAVALPGSAGVGSRAERAALLRLLGDLLLRDGDPDGSERRFEEARAGSPDADGQARALRGVAHARAVRGEFAEALQVLESAASLAGGAARPEVLAGIAARTVELEIVMGAYGRAQAHAEALVASTTEQRLVDHQAEAVSLLAESLAAIGLLDDAVDAASNVDGLARHLGPRGAEARVRAARAACEAGRADLALRLLAPIGKVDDGVVDDLQGQVLAVRARALVRSEPARARELANEALARREPMLAIRAARIDLDAAVALLESGSHAAARAAVKRGLKVVQGTGNRGLKLELMIAMYRAEPDHRVVEAVAKSALKILEELPEHCASPFRARGVIANALERYEAQGG